MKRTTFLLIITIIFLSQSCTKSEPKIVDDRVQVFTSILPQKFLVDRIGGDFVNTQSIVGSGDSPATYQPTPNQIMALSQADILFKIDVPYEEVFLKKITATLKNLKIIDTSAGINKRHIDSHNHDGDKSTHSEAESLDPHVWLSPVLAKVQAKTILNSLISLDPNNKEYYKTRYDKLILDLDNITFELHAKLAPLKGKTMFVYHPSFGYFTDEFGLNQEAIESGGKEPTPAQLEEIISEAITDGVRIIIVQPEFSIKSAKAIASAINGTVTTMNPLEVNYIENLRKMGNTIVTAYK